MARPFYLAAPQRHCSQTIGGAAIRSRISFSSSSFVGVDDGSAPGGRPSPLSPLPLRSHSPSPSPLGREGVEEDPRDWACRRPEVARRILSVPSEPPRSAVGPAGAAGAPSPRTLEDYLIWRDWDLPSASLQSGGESDVAKGEESSAVSLLSHPLTYPLTLGANLGAFSAIPRRREDGGLGASPDPAGHEREESENNALLRLCCVGARAEATLPGDFWREALLMASVLTAAEGNGETGRLPCRELVLDFVGPDVPGKMPSRTFSLTNPSCGYDRMSMTFQRSYLHALVLDRYKAMGSHAQASQRLLNMWDGFVLFNPGLGHPNLKEGWGPTLRYILKSGSPILLTAHSDLDAQRDWSALGGKMDEIGQGDRWRGCSSQFRPNPFASKLEYNDPFFSPAEQDRGGKECTGEGRVVRPNHSFLVLPAFKSSRH